MFPQLLGRTGDSVGSCGFWILAVLERLAFLLVPSYINVAIPSWISVRRVFTFSPGDSGPSHVIEAEPWS